MKKFELQHAFQGDDLSILTQTYYRLMDRSDPVIQSYSVERRIRKRKKKDIPQDEGKKRCERKALLCKLTKGGCSRTLEPSKIIIIT